MTQFVDLQERVLVGQALVAEIRQRVNKTVDTILVVLTRKYRDGKLSPEQALAGIGEVSSLKSLLSNVESDLKHTLKEVEKANAPGRDSD